VRDINAKFRYQGFNVAVINDFLFILESSLLQIKNSVNFKDRRFFGFLFFRNLYQFPKENLLAFGAFFYIATSLVDLIKSQPDLATF